MNAKLNEETLRAIYTYARSVEKSTAYSIQNRWERILIQERIREEMSALVKKTIVSPEYADEAMLRINILLERNIITNEKIH